MSVEVAFALKCTVSETLETNVPALASGDALVHSAFDASGTLNATSMPPVTKSAAFNAVLVAGAKTIDLTALTGTNGAAIDGTGLKVQLFKIKNPLGNAAVTVKFGAANPYNLLGASWTMILQPGDEFLFKSTDTTPDVAAGAKNIDLAGTGTQSFQVIVVMG